jgi:hypothetical protein
MSTKLGKGSLLSNEVIEDLQGASDDIESVSVIVRSSEEDLMAFISSLSGNLEGTSGVSDVSLGLLKVD